MSTPENNREPWLDQELRNVPLPAGLVARLKEIGTGPEAQLDAALSDVPLPPGLLGRLKAVAREEPLDRALTAVPVPDRLLTRLHGIASYDDAEIDAQLQAIDVPDELLDRLHAIGHRRRSFAGASPRALAAWALAASVLIAVGMASFGRLFHPAGVGPVAENAPPAVPVAPPAESDLPSIPQFSFLAPQPGAGPATESAPLADLNIQPPLASHPAETAAASPELDAPEPEGLVELEPPLAELIATPAVPDNLPEPELVEPLAPRGVMPPRVKQYDFLALLRDHVHPFVAPSADPQLATSQVPLVTSTTSYQRARDALLLGRMPDAGMVRTEEFLAAIDYEFPRPLDAALGVRTAAGPSPFGEEGDSLLQIGVQAGAAPPSARPVAHLTFAIDASASMARGERLESIRQALSELVSQLGARDQIAIVVFSEQAEVLTQGAGVEQAAQLLPIIQGIQSRSSTNLGSGLQLASHVAVHAAVDQRVARRIVLLTDGLGQMPTSVVQRMTDLAGDTRAQGVTLEVIDVGMVGSLDPRLEGLAQAGGGRVRQADGAQAIHHRLLEILNGQSQVVARDARLTVKFNPAVVERYRLLGHEADVMGGLVGGVLTADLQAGEAATALYELKLKPGGGDEVAVATLAWRDPESGATRQVTQRISRLQFATSLLESPLALQRAAVAAETAEVLRGSKFAPSLAPGLRQVAEIAEQLALSARKNSQFEEFSAVIEMAQQVRGGRAPVRGARPWVAIPRN